MREAGIVPASALRARRSGHGPRRRPGIRGRAGVAVLLLLVAAAAFGAGLLVGRSGSGVPDPGVDGASTRRPGGADPGTAGPGRPGAVPSGPAEASDPDPGQLLALLDGGRPERAVRLYESVYRRGPAVLAERLRVAFLAWAREASPRSGEAALAAYLGRFARDPEALRLLSDLRLQQGRWEDAVDPLVEALLAGPDGEASQRLRVLLASYAQTLTRQGDFDRLIALYERLVTRLPHDDEYRVRLARWYALAERRDEARAVLDRVADVAGHRASIDAVEALLSGADRGVPVPVRTGPGDAVVASVRAGAGSFPLLLDTGATLTVLRPGALQRIPAAEDLRRTVRLQTAGGTVEAPVYRVRGLRLGGVALPPLDVSVLELPGLGSVDGLLGMNALAGFDFELDRRAGTLWLRAGAPGAGGP